MNYGLTNPQAGFTSLQCGYERYAGAALVAFAEYITSAGTLRLVATGMPQLYAGRVSIPSSKTIRISNVNFQDERIKYYCKMTYNSGWWQVSRASTVYSAELGLSTVYTMPWLAAPLLPAVTNVNENTSVTLSCTVISKPISTVSWQFDPSLNVSQSQTVSVYRTHYTAVTATLIVQNVPETSTGSIISCRAMPRYGNSVSQSTTLIIKCKYLCETWNNGCNYACSRISSSYQDSSCDTTSQPPKDTCIIKRTCLGNAAFVYQPNNTISCQCQKGYRGKSCSLTLNECRNSSCGTNGKCLTASNTCGCAAGFTGRHCSVDMNECLNNTNCKNNATCIDGVNSYTCKCAAGFTGRHCSVDMDECLSNANCKNNATCIDGVNSYTCKCAAGFTGRHCSVDMDECLNNTNCKNNATCIDGVNSYTCKCAAGFTGLHCDEKSDRCLQNQCQNGICVEDKTTYICRCFIGYTGKYCDADINECNLQASGVCNNNGVCIAGNNTFHCKCADGYGGSRCEINQSGCRSNPCFNGGICMAPSALGNGYVCKCNAEFTGRRCENRFDPCASTPCQNEASCANSNENEVYAYKCNCLDGYAGQTCQFFYGHTIISILLKSNKARSFNESEFKVVIAESLNIYCSSSPKECPQTPVFSSRIFKPSDVKFLPAYPKKKPNGLLVVRIFVIYKSKPGTVVVMNPSTVKKALSKNSKLYSFDVLLGILSVKSETQQQSTSEYLQPIVFNDRIIVYDSSCETTKADRGRLKVNRNAMANENRNTDKTKLTKRQGEAINMVSLDKERSSNLPSCVNKEEAGGGTKVTKSNEYANTISILKNGKANLYASIDSDHEEDQGGRVPSVSYANMKETSAGRVNGEDKAAYVNISEKMDEEDLCSPSYVNTKKKCNTTGRIGVKNNQYEVANKCSTLGRRVGDNHYEVENEIGRRVGDSHYEVENEIGRRVDDNHYEVENEIGRRVGDNHYEVENEIGRRVDDNGYEVVNKCCVKGGKDESSPYEVMEGGEKELADNGKNNTSYVNANSSVKGTVQYANTLQRNEIIGTHFAANPCMEDSAEYLQSGVSVKEEDLYLKIVAD
eukprot:gene8054-8917_t